MNNLQVHPPRIIGFSGLKYAGKDTAGSAFVERGWRLMKFAEPMKIMLAELLEYRGAPRDEITAMLEGDLKEVPTPYLDGRTPRHALQSIGTEWGRVLMFKEIWTNSLVDRVKSWGGTPCVVITDVRFHNEATAIKALGGQVFRIIGRGATGDLHPSEREIPELDVTGEIMNDCESAEAFKNRVVRIFFS